MANNEGTPLHGDRSAWNTTDHAGEHARDIDESALLRHLPAPSVANNFPVDNGTNWVTKTLAQVVALIESLLDHGNIQGLSDGSDHSFINQNVTTTGTPTFGITTLADGSKLVTAAAPVADVDIANKKYVDDGVAGATSDLVDDLTPQLGGDLDMNGHGIDFPTTPNITDVLDEDDMASDSATKLATQQSIKKYVDDNVGGGGGSGSIAVSGAFTAEWKADGILSAVTEVDGSFIAPEDGTIQSVSVHAQIPGSAGSTILDVNINGTTAYTTQGNRPTLAYDDADGILIATAPDVTSVSAGDIITVDIDQVATGASSLSVTILLTGTETVTHALISDTDADTDVTGLELEELTDGSETTLHSHADSDTVTAKVYHNAAQAVASGAGPYLAFNSERWDTDSFHDTVTNNSRLTIPANGYYLITTNIEFSGHSTGVRVVNIVVNRTTAIASITFNPSHGGSQNSMVTTIHYLTAGQYVETQVYQNSGISLNIASAGDYTPEFSIVKLG